MEADIEVCQVDAARMLLLALPTMGGEELRALADKYVFTEDARFTDRSSEFAALGLVGPRVGEVLDELGAPRPDADAAVRRFDFDGSEAFVLGTCQLPGGVLLLLPLDAATQSAPKIQSALAKVGGCLVGWDAIEALRIARKLPTYRVDTTAATIPLEADLMDGIHTNKGCYPGQETIAKTMNLGHPARKLVIVETPERVTATLPAPLLIKGKEIGSLTSLQYSTRLGKSIGLATVRFLYAEDGYEAFLPDGTEVVMRTEALVH
jgi:folate-binding protein YgfZ